MTTKPAKVNEKRGHIVPSAKSHLRGLPPRSASNGFFILQANALSFFTLYIPPFPMMIKLIHLIRRIEAARVAFFKWPFPAISVSITPET